MERFYCSHCEVTAGLGFTPDHLGLVCIDHSLWFTVTRVSAEGWVSFVLFSEIQWTLRLWTLTSRHVLCGASQIIRCEQEFTAEWRPNKTDSDWLHLNPTGVWHPLRLSFLTLWFKGLKMASHTRFMITWSYPVFCLWASLEQPKQKTAPDTLSAKHLDSSTRSMQTWEDSCGPRGWLSVKTIWHWTLIKHHILHKQSASISRLCQGFKEWEC